MNLCVLGQNMTKTGIFLDPGDPPPNFYGKFNRNTQKCYSLNKYTITRRVKMYMAQCAYSMPKMF